MKNVIAVFSGSRKYPVATVGLANIPTSPGASSSPSGENTLTPGAASKFAVKRESPRRTCRIPYVTPSVVPHASTSTTSGMCSKRRSLMCALHATPAEQMARSDPVS